jgi:hypothetical protein
MKYKSNVSQKHKSGITNLARETEPEESKTKKKPNSNFGFEQSS